MSYNDESIFVMTLKQQDLKEMPTSRVKDYRCKLEEKAANHALCLESDQK